MHLPRHPGQAGIGLRLPHLAEVTATRPTVEWVEIHAENFLANPHARELLTQVAARYPISIHTVGVCIGSADGVDRAHLDRVRALVAALNPFLVSGHLAWSTHLGVYLNDLLPLPYDDATLCLVTNHLDEVQNLLGRPYFVENPSSYVAFDSSTMTEPQFLSELVRRSGFRLLCDVSNIYLSAHNMGFDAYAYIDALPTHAVGELHLGGFTREDDETRPGTMVLIDTHATGITEPVWELYAHVVRRFGWQPTLIEWDNDLPSFAAILAEAAQADRVAIDALIPEARRAGAR